jgi:RecJ-like exonuclease
MRTENQCRFCGGTGKCATCNGSGVNSEDAVESLCAGCDGQGECLECGGSGKPKSALYEFWDWFCSLEDIHQRFVVAAAVGVIAGFVAAWQIMLPLLGLIIGVALFLRISHTKESL